MFTVLISFAFNDQAAPLRWRGVVVWSVCSKRGSTRELPSGFARSRSRGSARGARRVTRTRRATTGWCAVRWAFAAHFASASLVALRRFACRGRAAFLALLHRIAEFADDDVDGAHRVIVARDRDVDEVWVTVGIDEADGRNAERAGLEKSVLLAVRIDDHERARHLRHLTNAAEVALDLLPLAEELRLHLLRVVLEFAALDNPIEFFEALEALANRAEVRQSSTEPTLGDERHLNVSGVLLDGAARLTLGADEANVLALADGLFDESLREEEALDRLAHIEDVDLVADAVNVRRHLRIPVAATLTEVNACLNEFLNERSHVCSPATPTQRVWHPARQRALVVDGETVLTRAARPRLRGVTPGANVAFRGIGECNEIPAVGGSSVGEAGGCAGEAGRGGDVRGRAGDGAETEPDVSGTCRIQRIAHALPPQNPALSDI